MFCGQSDNLDKGDPVHITSSKSNRRRYYALSISFSQKVIVYTIHSHRQRQRHARYPGLLA